MKKLIFGERLNKVIDLAKEHYQNHDGCFEELEIAEHECFGDDYSWIHDIITGLTCKTRDKNTPIEVYYRVIQCLGYKIISEYEEDKNGNL